MNEDKRKISTTTDGQPPDPEHDRASAPKPIDPATGQHGAYWVLTPEERAKGFVRPVRRSYVHVGSRPKNPLRDLTPEERERFAASNYVAFEAYSDGTLTSGRFWTEAQLKSGCGGVTTMGVALAETYARDPKYYGATFCAHCKTHLPVGEDGEFVWEGTDEKVGT